MNAERIKQLHEEASERYLNADYPGALQAWRDVLGLDPADEQARAGVRMAAQFVEAPAPAFATGSPEIENELDRGLMILDSHGATDLPQRPPEENVEHAATAEAAASSEIDEILDGWDAPAEPAAEEGAFGLEPLTRSFPPGSPPATPPAPAMSAAAAELKRRVDDLLGEAKAKADAGERDEALAILSRLGILDEDNSEAEALRAKIEAAGASDLDQVERDIIEGVAALEADRLDDAEGHFRAVLARAPEHREALDYLQRIAQRRTGGHEELLSDLGGEASPSDGAVHRATAPPTAAAAEAIPLDIVPASAAQSKSERLPAAAFEPLDAPAAMKRPRLSLPSRKFLIAGGIGAAVLACAALALPHMLGGSAKDAAAPQTLAFIPRGGRPAKPGPKKPAVASSRPIPATPEALAKAIADGLASGRSLMTSGDYGGAVVAFNDVLELDPGNPTAKAGLTEAGDHYKATKAEREAIGNIKLAFRDEEFTSGLRLAYRLPPSVPTAFVDGIKVAGWYNLAVVSLRAGDCREAQKHLDDALEIAPADAEAKGLREFASRYVDAVKDRSFLNHVEALAFRPMPSS
jgi:tetratricopeptide (TPR) repeat protein